MQRIKSILGPLLVRYLIAYVVEIIILSGFFFYHYQGTNVSIENQEQLYAQMEVVLEMVAPYTVQIGTIAAIVTIPILIGMMKKDRKLENVTIKDKKMSVVKYVFAGLMSIAFAIGINNILLLLNIAEYSVSYQESAEVLYSPAFSVQLVCLGVIYPIMEELIFRGLIFQRMREKSPFFLAACSSAAIFGLYHGNSVQMIYGALSGLLLAYFCETFGTVKASIMAHILMNVTAVILTELDAFTWMFHVPIRMVIITVICAFVASSMYVLMRQERES